MCVSWNCTRLVEGSYHNMHVTVLYKKLTLTSTGTRMLDNTQHTHTLNRFFKKLHMT